MFDTHSDQGTSPDPSIVDALIKMLDQCNPLVQQFRAARQRLFSPEGNNIAICILGSDSSQSDHYIPPSKPELAALIVGDLNAELYEFDIVVHALAGPLRHVSPLHPTLMVL